jgi:hypothetical protein
LRAALDLSTSDSAQLQRTNADLEEMIRHKDLLIATQLSVIEAMEERLAQASSPKVPLAIAHPLIKTKSSSWLR